MDAQVQLSQFPQFSSMFTNVVVTPKLKYTDCTISCTRALNGKCSCTNLDDDARIEILEKKRWNSTVFNIPCEVLTYIATFVDNAGLQDCSRVSTEFASAFINETDRRLKTGSLFVHPIRLRRRFDGGLPTYMLDGNCYACVPRSGKVCRWCATACDRFRIRGIVPSYQTFAGHARTVHASHNPVLVTVTENDRKRTSTTNIYHKK